MYQDIASPFQYLCPSSESFLLSFSGYQCLCDNALSLLPYPSDFNLTKSQIRDYLANLQADHVLNRTPNSDFYVLLSTYQSDLQQWLSLFQSLDLSLILRPYHSRSTSPQPNSRLGGYAVTLDIKNTEYKVIDDRSSHGTILTENDAVFAEPEVEVEGFYFATLLSRYPALEQQLSSFRESLITDQSEAAETITPIQMKDLGLKMVQRVSHAQDPLRSLADGVLQFPAAAASIAHVPISEKLENEWSALSSIYRSIGNGFIANGKWVSMAQDSFNIFQFLEDIRSSFDMKHYAKELGLSAEALDRVRQIAKYSILDDFSKVRLSRQIWESDCIWFLNDIEKDSAYSRFPKKLNYFFVNFGLPMVRTNYLNYVVVVDPMKVDTEVLLILIQILRERFPIHYGILFTSPAIRSFFQNQPNTGIPVNLGNDIHPVQLLGLLLKLYKSGHKLDIPLVLYSLISSNDFETEHVINEFNKVMPSMDGMSYLLEEHYLSELSEINTFVVKHGIQEQTTFLNGRIGDFFSFNSLIRASFEDLELIVQGISSKEILSLGSIMDYIYSNCTVIYTYDEQLKIPFWDQTFTPIDFNPSGDFVQINAGVLGKAFLIVPSFSSIQSLFSVFRLFSDYSLYIGTGDETLLPSLRLLRYATDMEMIDLMEEVMHCAKDGSVAELKKCIQLYLEEDELSKLGEKWISEDSQVTSDFVSDHITLILNGRIVECNSFSESFIRSLVMLDKVLTQPLHQEFDQDLSRLVPFIHQFLGTFGEIIPSLPSDSPFVLSKHSSSSLIHISAILDPLTTVAQREISLFIQLRSVVDISYDILLLPSRDYSQLPLKRFYQFVLSDEQQAVWHNLPMHYLYTMSIETPFKWSTVAYYAECDLDNLRILDESTYILAQYIVDGIVMEGSCFKDDKPAAGVMLQMNHYPSSQLSSDTVVMNNMGYWQLRGNMGFYEITVSEENNDAQLVDMKGNAIESVKVCK